jgi:hypothetical protein
MFSNIKSQLKIQEMAFMLMAVVIFIILAGLFFFSFEYRQMFKEANTLSKEKAISTISNLASLPELNFGQTRCIDSDKLLALVNNERYKSFLPLTSLSLIKIGEKNQTKCSIESYPNCNYYEIYSSSLDQEMVSTFTCICRKERAESGYDYNTCELAKIIAGSEVKNA